MLTVEAATFAAVVSLLAARVCWRRARTAALRARLHAARTVLARALAGDETPSSLPRLPWKATVEVFADAARNVDVSARQALASFPAYDRLAARAERWCASRRWSRRRKGVRLLTILGAGGDAAARLLDDPRAEVRSEAAAWAVQHPTAPRIARLVEMLADDAHACRLVAQAALIRLGSRALEPLVRHLHQPDPAALVSALGVAARLPDASLRGPALAHRRHPDPAVRAGAARVLAAVGGDEAVDAVQQCLTDTNTAVRAAAAQGLGTLGHWPSAPSLADRLGDPAWQVRRAAGLALHRLGAPGRLYLQRALRDSDAFAADMAHQTLDLPEALAPGGETS